MTKNNNDDLPQASHSNNRENDRQILEMPAKVKQVDISIVDCMILDFSANGFLIGCSAGLNQSKNLMLKIPGFEMMHAKIVWAKGDEYGCEFTQHLYPAVFDHITKRESK